MKTSCVENPVIQSDFPDPDIIRVGDVYYMASTTMFLMPGGDLLRSYDLVHWEPVGHVFDMLGEQPADRLQDGHIYAQGMWAPSLRFHDGTFYLTFSCNDLHRSLLFTARNPEGPWERRDLDDFYYDASVLFDDDGRLYIVHGNTRLFLTELDPVTWKKKEGGRNILVAQDEPGQPLGYEGSHIYHANGKYLVFTCHMPKEAGGRKTECCFISDSLDKPFRGKTILQDGMGYRPQFLVAQGGMVDTPDGGWYLFMYQDRGALGRAPVVMPMRWDGDGFPVPDTDDGHVPLRVSGTGAHPEHLCRPLSGNSFLETESGGSRKLAFWWQFSHNPDRNRSSFSDDGRQYLLRTGKRCSSLLQAPGTLTQRTTGPESSAQVTIDGSRLAVGDMAGLAAYTGHYAALAVTRTEDGLDLVRLLADAGDATVFGDRNFFTREPKKKVLCRLSGTTVRVRVDTDFRREPDVCTLWYLSEDGWQSAGDPHPLYFKMDTFIGCRFALFAYAEGQGGGTAVFSDFELKKGE